MGGRGGRIFQETNRASKLPIFEDERRIQQPDDYNVRFLSELGVKEHLEAKARGSIKSHEKGHFLDHKEQGAIFDKNGKCVYYTKGGMTQVKLPGHLCKDNIVTHNHPAVIPVFSPADINSAVVSGSHEERVTGLSGQTTRLWFDKGVSQDTKNAFAKEYERVFMEAHNHAKNKYLKKLNEQGLLARYEGMTEHYLNNFPDYIKVQAEYVEKHMDFKKYGVNYARTKEF